MKGTLKDRIADMRRKLRAAEEALKPVVCADCFKTFTPDSGHERKFCCALCAHRNAAREWKRRERDKAARAGLSTREWIRRHKGK